MARPTVSGRRRSRLGFTLIEMMVVMAIIVTILSVAVPMYRTTMVRSRESVLKSNLFTLRNVIDQYTYDKETPPQALEDLVSEGYLRQVPVDPMTESSDTWQIINDTGPTGQSGIFDVRSGSDRNALDGSKYSDW